MADNDVSQSITLTATGGDASANEIKKSADALNTVTSASSAMQTQFQEKFQHVGLKLFAGDAIKGIGLGGEMRQAITIMNMALSGAEEAAGIASGGFTLLLTALAAVAAIVYKVVSNHKDLIDTLDKTYETQQKTLDSTNTNVEALQKYASAGGDMTASLSAMLTASEALRAAQMKQQEATDLQIISTLKSTIAEQEHAIAVTKSINLEDLKYLANVRTSQAATQGAELMKKLTDSVAAQTLALDANNVKLQSAQVDYDNLTSGVVTNLKTMADAEAKHKDAVIKGIEDEIKEREKAADKADQLQQKMDQNFNKVVSDMASKESGYITNSTNQSTVSAQKKIDNILNWQQQQEAALQKAYYKEVDIIEASVEDETKKNEQLSQLSNQFYAAETALNQDARNKMAAADTKYYDAFKNITTTMSNDIGRSFAQMIVQGKSFSDAMKSMFQDMAIQFIEKVIAMAIEWLALRAVMSIWPGGAAAYQGVAQAAYPAVAQQAYQGIGNGGAQAEGGSYRVDQPTMFLAGEAGSEIATFTPIGDLNNPDAAGGGGQTPNMPAGKAGAGGGNVSMGDINVTVQLASMGAGDVNTMLKQLAAQIRTASVDAVRFAVTSANLAKNNQNLAV